MKIAIIAGASGLVGGQLLNLLLEDKFYTKVLSIGRRKLEITHPKLEQVVVDFQQLDKLDIKPEAVFCCLGTTIKKAGSKEVFKKVDFEYPKMLADYAFKNGAKSYHIITSMGADSNSSIFYNRVKGEIEEELRGMPFEQLHIYRPSLLLGKRQESRRMEGVGQAVMKALGFLFAGPLKNYKAVSGENVAKFMLDRSTEPSEGVLVHLSAEMQ